MKKVLFLLCFGAISASAQHQMGHTMAMPADTTKPMKGMDHSKMDHRKMDHSGMGNGQMTHDMGMAMSNMNAHEGDTASIMIMPMGVMSHALSRNLPMNRNGSGTSWMPDQTPMYAYMAPMKMDSKWMYMLHYSVFLRHTHQNFNNTALRGYESRYDAPNWAMGMAQRTVGKRGLFTAKLMVSLDALTVGNGGYPLLFQTGESYKGQPLVDRQHPHDLFSELSVSYAHAISRDMDAFVYVGYPGEPALGAPAFMHRISSFNISDAPLSHHWIDATHITFGVATAGFRYKWAKVEVSSFTGREPDEYRFNFDKPRFDSYSYRLSINPSPGLALQVSQGLINSPEVLGANQGKVRRTTASVLHSRPLGGGDHYITSSLIWGNNNHDGVSENAYLAESSLQLGRLALYGRYENVTKSLAELVLPASTGDAEHSLVNVDNLTLGSNWRLLRRANTDLAVGAQLTASLPSRELTAFYGTMPISGQLYLRLTPALLVRR